MYQRLKELDLNNIHSYQPIVERISKDKTYIYLMLQKTVKIKPDNISGTLPLSNDDWVINDTTIVENEELIVNGSILIQNGGALILKNTTIFMNLTYDGEHRIEVYSGGNLTVINSTITAYNTTNNYYIKVNNGGKLIIDGSEISYAGTGIWINTDNITIKNSKIHHNDIGIYIYYASNIEIENNNIAEVWQGVKIYYANNITFLNNSIINCDYGLIIAGVNFSLFGDNTFINCTSYGLDINFCNENH